MQIIKLKASKQKYRIIDDEYNRKIFPDLINQIFTSPPNFIHVELVKEERKTFQELYEKSVKNINPMQKFVTLALKENYTEKEIIQRISELYNKNIEESLAVFREIILKLAGIKGDKDETS